MSTNNQPWKINKTVSPEFPYGKLEAELSKEGYRKSGVTDINGIEILEGSIINADGYNSNIQEGNFHCVEFYEGQFGSDIYSDFEPLARYGKIEVIGHAIDFIDRYLSGACSGNLGAILNHTKYPPPIKLSQQLAELKQDGEGGLVLDKDFVIGYEGRKTELIDGKEVTTYPVPLIECAYPIAPAVTEQEEQPIFYIKDNRDNSEWAIYEIEPDEHRKGWLRGKCVNMGNDDKNYIGAAIGVSASFVFDSGMWDYSKQSFTIQRKQ